MSILPTLPKVNASPIVTATCILALLHFGREVLEPLALALILSLIIAPLILCLRRIGLGHAVATLVSVILCAVCVVGVSVILAAQLVAVTVELPQYRAAIQTKLETVRQITERPFVRLEQELRAVAPALPPTGSALRAKEGLAPGLDRPIPVEIHTPQASMTDTVTRLLSVVSGPVGEAGLVLILLVFILLEHESLRDRFVRLTGQGEAGRTVKALGDTTEGVSRFFFSQFVVNVIFGVVVGIALWAVGVPHAALFGALSGLLRFVPYLGALVAGAAITLFVAAIDPGWTLALVCLAMFGALEVIVANVVEPKVYGHSSGLSPLAVMVSALFWGAMWGPVGLLLSTPLTLCLVVAGRHVRALEPITILLASTPSVDLAQRFYYRILSGEAEAIIRDAQAFLQTFSFARYCDHVLLPGLALAVDEFESGRIENAQQDNIRKTIAALAETLMLAKSPGQARKRRRISMLDANVGAHLRQLRQQHFGRWQGSLDVPQRSVVLCAGLPTERDELINELLVLALREADVDARSVVVGDENDKPGPDKSDLLSTVLMAYPQEGTLDQWLVTVRELRLNLPKVELVTIRLLSNGSDATQTVVEGSVDLIMRSFEEAVAFLMPGSPS